MKYLFFDLSEKCSAFAVIEGGQLVSYGNEQMTSQLFGESLFKLKVWLTDIIHKINTTNIGIEDIFSQSITGYKKLAKIQGIAELVCYNYNKSSPLFANASAIRKYFKLNIQKVLTEKQYNKKISKKKNNVKTYWEYLKDENHYYNKFKAIDFNVDCYRIIDGKLVDTRKIKKVKISSTGNIKSIGSKINQFDFAKKIVIIDFINRTFKTNFDYNDNDICDAILGAYYYYLLAIGVITKNSKKGIK